MRIFSGQSSVNERGAERAEHAARFALPPSLCPPEPTRRRRREVTQVSSTEVECASAAHVRERLIFDCHHSNERNLAPSAAQVPRSVSWEICGSLQAKRLVNEAVDELKTALAPPLLPASCCSSTSTTYTSERRCYRMQMGRSTTRKTRFRFALLQRRLLSANFCSGEFMCELGWRWNSPGEVVDESS